MIMWNQNISVPEVIAIQRLKDGLNVAELFHGPTLAFKDLALTFVGELYNYFLEKSKKNCIIVVGKYYTYLVLTLFTKFFVKNDFTNFLYFDFQELPVTPEVLPFRPYVDCQWLILSFYYPKIGTYTMNANCK